MKLPIAIFILLATTLQSAKAVTATTATIDEQQYELGNSWLDLQQRESNFLLPHHSTQHEHPTRQRQLQSSSSSTAPICSCSPTTYTIRLDFSKTCNVDTIKSNFGIHGTLCLLGEMPPPPGLSPPPTSSTLPPVDDPFLPPRPPTTTTAPVVGTIPSPTPGGNEGEKMPTWWPTFSPTTTEWAQGGVGGAGGMPTTAGGTYAPTIPWPTYSPTSSNVVDDPSSSQVSPGETIRDINIDDSSSLTKKQLKDIKTSIRQSGGSVNDMKSIRQDGLKSNLLQSNFGLSTEEYMNMNKKDRKDVKKHVRGIDLVSQHAIVVDDNSEEEDLTDYFEMLEQHEEDEEMSKKEMKELKKQMRTAGIHHYDSSSSKSDEPAAAEGMMMERTAELLAHHFAAAATQTHPTTTGTLDPTASPPTTYYPTDDQTYSPTTTGHMNNLELHSSNAAGFGPEGARQRRRLTSSTNRKEATIGQWTSISPNDEFFTKYPEWKSRQEEIYKLRNDKSSTAPLDDHVDVDGGGSSTSRQLQDTTGLIPNELFSAQFLEMDTSTNMNIINQDDSYLNNATFPPSDNGITDYTLTYTSISSTLNPDLPIEEQLDIVPGGVILILVALTDGGEVIRNRIMWTYTMGCGMEDVTVLNGDEFGWAMFEKLESASEEFCPASSRLTMAPTSTPTIATVPGTPTNSPVTYTTQPPADSPRPTRMPTSKKPTSDSGSKPSTSSSVDVIDYDNIGPGAKASKPAKPEGMSMPGGSGTSLIMDHFDLSSSRSGRRRQMTEHLHSGKRRQMNDDKRRQGRRETSPQLENVLSRKSSSEVEEEDREVFGRRISKHREATRRRRDGVLFIEEVKNEEAISESTHNVRKESDSVHLHRDTKRKLRRSV